MKLVFGDTIGAATKRLPREELERLGYRVRSAAGSWRLLFFLKINFQRHRYFLLTAPNSWVSSYAAADVR
jgi:hypothetical protein